MGNNVWWITKVIYFICSDDNLVSRKNLFEFKNFLNYIFANNYFDRQDTLKTNINTQKTKFIVEKERIQFPKGKQREFIKYAKLVRIRHELDT